MDKEGRNRSMGGLSPWLRYVALKRQTLKELCRALVNLSNKYMYKFMRSTCFKSKNSNPMSGVLVMR